MRKAVVALIAVILAIAGCAGTGSTPAESKTKAAVPEQSLIVQGIVYVSDKGEILTATFDNKKETVEVKLPDGKVVMLPRAISASGARYSNGHETFWEYHGEGSTHGGTGRRF